MITERIKYPDGQISAKVTIPSYDDSKTFQISERINSYEDLFYVRCLADAYSSAGKSVTIFIPCLFGQRSDQRFSEAQSFDLKLICETINACKATKVEILDPHSTNSLALIENSVKIDPFFFIKGIIVGLRTVNCLVSPDAGAYKKVFDCGEKLGLPVVAAVKHRDLDGKINLQFIGDVAGKHCLIVDDLADGGYTFVQLSEKLKQQGANKVYLYVSHGYFSKGFGDLKKNIDHIYCTNSVKDIEDEFVTQFKVI